MSETLTPEIAMDVLQYHAMTKEKEELLKQIRSLEYDKKQMISKREVRDALIALAEELTTSTDKMNSDQLGELNEALAQLDLSLVEQEVTFTVEVTFTQEVEFTKECVDPEKMKYEIENGYHDDDIRGHIETDSVNIIRYRDIRIVS
jgi:hypothetical protein